jgi:hypothetical protein
MWGVDLAASALCLIGAGPAPPLRGFLACWDELHPFAECAARALDPEYGFFSMIDVALGEEVYHAGGLLLPRQSRRRFSLNGGQRLRPLGVPAAGCVIRGAL